MIRYIQVNDLPWEPHPVFRDLVTRKLLTHKKDNLDLSFLMVKFKEGFDIPAHVHEQDDIIYHLEGKGRM